MNIGGAVLAASIGASIGLIATSFINPNLSTAGMAVGAVIGGMYGAGILFDVMGELMDGI